MDIMENSTRLNKAAEQEVSNKDLQGVDKAPGEEKDKGEKVTKEDLKGKKVDADPERTSDLPISQLP